jgi:RNA polymerase sigma factor (sigma-70 family)
LQSTRISNSIDASRPDGNATFPRAGDENLCHQLRAYMGCRSQKANPSAPLAAAWDHFYDDHTPRIRAFLRRCSLPSADREVCFQEVWSEVVAHLGHLGYDPRRVRLSTWLMTVARNRAVDTLRRRRSLSTASIGDGAALLDSDSGPVATCDRHRTQDRVRRVLAELSERVIPLSFQVLYQRAIEGRTNAEVAETLGLTPAQVRFRLRRMKRKFRELFEQSVRPDRPGREVGQPGHNREKQIPAQHAGPSHE